MDFTTALLSAPAIIALVNILKRIGLPEKLAPIVAIIIGIGLNLATWAWSGTGWFTAASQGLITALAASGLYDLALPGNNVKDNSDVSE